MRIIYIPKHYTRRRHVVIDRMSVAATSIRYSVEEAEVIFTSVGCGTGLRREGVGVTSPAR